MWGHSAMPSELFMRSVGQVFPQGLVFTAPNAQAYVACLVATQPGISALGSWLDVYRLAFEQARAALEPSRFQIMLQPGWN